MATDEQVMSAISAAVQAVMTQTLPVLLEQVKGSGKSGGQGDLVEKLVRRTDHFKGEGFAEWRFRALVSWTAIHSDGKALMEWVEGRTTGVNRSVDIAEEKRNTDSLMYYFLTAVTHGEAFDIVKNVNDQCGAEAWRRLCKRYGSKTKGKRVCLTRKCVSPPRLRSLRKLPG